jgi:hypothetical protein
VGSLRNPVGPLPSSIYWRRRVVASALVLVIAALVIWAVTRGSGGGGHGNGASGPTGSHTPIGTITAGPTPSGTHISGRPGGRDTAPSDSDGGTGDGTSAGDTGSAAGDTAGSTAGSTAGDDSGATAGSGSDGGTSSGTSAGTGTSGSGGAGTSAGSGPSGDQVPAGSTLPNCSPGTVSLALTSDQNTYADGQTPVLRLRATNSGSVTCKLDFGPRSAVFTVTKNPEGSHVWASNDCPANASPYLLQVPAHGSTTYTLNWSAKTSSPQCGSPKNTPAGYGNYLAQVSLAGYGTKSVPFRLSQD